MSLIALTAAKSAGVTTSALALAGVWPNPVLLAECDPAGGDIAAGLLCGGQPGPGLLELALATRHGLTQQQFWDHTTALSDDAAVRLLAGLTDPAQHSAIDPTWPLLIQMFRALDPPGSTGQTAAGGLDVLADCGRLAVDTPAELLAGADRVLLVLRPSLGHVAHTRSRLAALRGRLAEHAAGPPDVGLLLVGTSPYPAAEVAAALDLPVVGVLADDPPAAAVLAGLASRRSRFDSSTLMRSARRVAADLHRAAHPAASPAAIEVAASAEYEADSTSVLAVRP